MTGIQPRSDVREFTIPDGCPVCEADLSVRVTASGPMGACGRCQWLGRPRLTVTHHGLRVSVDPAQA